VESAFSKERGRRLTPPPVRDPDERSSVIGEVSDITLDVSRLEGHVEHEHAEAFAATKVVGATAAILYLSIYCISVIRDTSMGLSSAFVAYFAVCLVGLLMYVGSAIGFEELMVSAKASPVAKLVQNHLNGDLARALGVFFAAPFFPPYLLLAYLNQRARVLYSHASGEKLPSDEHELVLTSLAHEQLERLREWPWASICLRLYLIALLAWTVLYGTTLTYMLFALLIDHLRTVACGTASLTFFGVGITMFLLPPVPGLAVYLTAGVLIPPACEMEMGFLNACFYSAFLAFLMKLCAQVLQQKWIGEGLGSSVAVRAAVGVNSDVIKAIRRILEQPGLTLAKVSLLCGGPDWPTAVLCGILKLNLGQMLLGLLPICLFTIPAAFAGAAQLQQAESDDHSTSWWRPLGTLAVMATSLQTAVLALLALYHIERIKHSVDMSGDPRDEEVAALEKLDADARAAFTEATRFDNMPTWPRVQLVSGSVVLTLSAYLLLFASAECFEEFALTDDVRSALCISCERAAVKPLGWLAFGMLAYALVCHIGWRRWAAGAVKAHTALL